MAVPKIQTWHGRSIGDARHTTSDGHGSWIRSIVIKLTDLTSSAAESYGKRFKDMEIAVDVVNFHLKDEPKFMGISRFGKAQLNEFVAAVNSNDNSHIEHVQPGASIREVLFKSILKDHPGHPNENNKHKDLPIRFGTLDLDIIPVA